MSLRKTSAPDLFSQLWIRTWHGDGDCPEWFPHGLRHSQPCLGYGVLEPLELTLSGSKMSSITAVTGVSLLENLKNGPRLGSEAEARSVVEQICFGVHRIHQMGTVHGALTPFNIVRDDRDCWKLWSVPTGRLELSVNPLDSEWEKPYRSPRVSEGNSPEVADDIYSLGVVFARLLGGGENLGLSDSARRVYELCVNQNSTWRFGAVKDLAGALNPETELLTIDTEGARVARQRGLEAFLQDSPEAALEHWQDALREDWLEFTAYNNAAVCQMRLKKWVEAIGFLEKAYKIYPHHHLVDANIGFCHNKLGDTVARDFWWCRSAELNPHCPLPHRLEAEEAYRGGRFDTALKFLKKALLAEPRDRPSRLLGGKLLKSLGFAKESEAHKAYAERLPEHPFLYEHLLTEKSPPPWSLRLSGKGSSVMERIRVESPSMNWLRKPK